jgi:para-nitrobenzyl esterase
MRKEPVLVWIHGGALTSGSSSERMYDGAKLAPEAWSSCRSTIVSAIWLLAHPQLSAESPRRISGNYGLLDQIEALRWVQRNIAAFGAIRECHDCRRIGGGLQRMYLMASPQARGLFTRAIAQSAYMISMRS